MLQHAPSSVRTPEVGGLAYIVLAREWVTHSDFCHLQLEFSSLAGWYIFERFVPGACRPYILRLSIKTATSDCILDAYVSHHSFFPLFCLSTVEDTGDGFCVIGVFSSDMHVGNRKILTCFDPLIVSCASRRGLLPSKRSCGILKIIVTACSFVVWERQGRCKSC